MSVPSDEMGQWPFDIIPPSWKWANFEKIFIEKTSSKKKLPQKNYLSEGSLPVVDQGEILIGGYTNDKSLRYDGLLPVLIWGDHTKVVKFIEVPFVQGADGVKVLRPTGGVDPLYAYYALKVIELPDKGYSRHFKFLKASLFPLPPLDEQRRIVAKLDSVLGSSRRTREELAHIPRLVERYKQAVLTKAFNGELTADWRLSFTNSFSGADELKMALALRKQKWITEQDEKAERRGIKLNLVLLTKNYEEPISNAEKRFELPNNWVFATIDQLSVFVTDGEHITPPRTDKGIFLLSARNIQNGFISLEKVDYITEETFTKLSDRLLVKEGDVLLSCSGTVGRSCIFPKGLQASFVRSVAIIRPATILSEYLSLALRSEDVQSQIRDRVTSTGQSNIFQGKIRTLSISFPPFEEQKEIVRRIEAAFARIDLLAAEAQKAAKLLDRFDQQALAKAFRGELVAPSEPE